MSRHRIEVEQTIDALVIDVWAVINDTARYGEWVDGVLDVVPHAGPAKVGASYEERIRKLGPLTGRTVWTIEELVPLRRRLDRGRGLAPLRDATTGFALAIGDDPMTTRMTYTFEFELPLGPVGALAGRLLRRTLSDEFARSMDALDALLRSERPIDRRRTSA